MNNNYIKKAATHQCGCGNHKPQTIKYRRENKELPTLYKELTGNAGYDLFANIPEPLEVKPGEVVCISLNVATEMPVNIVGLVFQRSSTYRKWGLKLTNGVGVIDSIFKGNEDIWEAEFKNETNQVILVNPGDKICQAVFLELPTILLEEVDKLEGANRGGFGTSPDNANDLE